MLGASLRCLEIVSPSSGPSLNPLTVTCSQSLIQPVIFGLLAGLPRWRSFSAASASLTLRGSGNSSVVLDFLLCVSVSVPLTHTESSTDGDSLRQFTTV